MSFGLDIHAMKPQFKRVTIIGVGLIGGSLGLAIKRRLRGVLVCGVDSTDVLRKARRRKAIDRAETNLQKAVSTADLVLLACPGKTILRLLPRVARFASPSAIVSDVGSVKSAVVRLGEKLFPNGNFIGGHPMAGVELSGIEAAHPLLFENAVYVLTPTKSTSAPQLRRLATFFQALGARVMTMNAEAHDEVAAALSHLPQLTAVALVNVVGRRHTKARSHLGLAAGGFRDLTRIASSRFEVWNDILAGNRANVEKALQMLIEELESYRSELKKKRFSALRREFETAREVRSAIPQNMKGFLHSLKDVYVYVQDRPGVLAAMTGALAKAKVNIKDIELLKVREGSSGTFRLSFDSTEIARQAANVLRRAGFEVEE